MVLIRALRMELMLCYSQSACWWLGHKLGISSAVTFCH